MGSDVLNEPYVEVQFETLSARTVRARAEDDLPPHTDDTLPSGDVPDFGERHVPKPAWDRWLLGLDSFLSLENGC